jgi:hypothetical protein
MSSLFRKVVGVSSHAPDNPMGRISLVNNLDDEGAFLSLMYRGSPERESVSAVDALCGVVAEVVHALGIEDGRHVVIPTVSLIQRNEHGNPDFETPLADLQGRLAATSDRVEMLLRSVDLGDRAVHVAAGWTGDPKQKNIMNMEERQRYAAQMAARGYVNAIGIASHTRHLSESQAILRVIPPIIRYFSKIVRILEALAQKAKGTFVNMTKIPILAGPDESGEQKLLVGAHVWAKTNRKPTPS